MSVVVSRSCTISTERGAAGAELDDACPTYARQSLVRELQIRSASPQDGAPSVGEHLYLVVNF